MYRPHPNAAPGVLAAFCGTHPHTAGSGPVAAVRQAVLVQAVPGDAAFRSTEAGGCPRLPAPQGSEP